jgi:hypothetical protein
VRHTTHLSVSAKMANPIPPASVQAFGGRTRLCVGADRPAHDSPQSPDSPAGSPGPGNGIQKTHLSGSFSAIAYREIGRVSSIQIMGGQQHD